MPSDKTDIKSFLTEKQKINDKSIPDIDDQDLIKKINEIKTESIDYRDSFSQDWIDIEEQINCIPPADWENKENWQTQVMVPMQFKISETAAALLSDILFAQRDFFGVVGTDNDKDRKQESELRRFIMVLLEKGGFFKTNGFVFQEAIDLGTSFIKILVDKKNKALKFFTSNIKESCQDPKSVTNFQSESRYFIQQYRQDLLSILNDNLYDKDAVNKLLIHLGEKSSNEDQEDLISISNAEGDTNLKISRKYLEVNMSEFWGWLPIKYTKTIDGQEIETWKYENKAITIADDTIKLREDDNEYEMIPYERCLIRRRLYHAYGKGFCQNLTGLQNLENSLVCLGFDTAKLRGVGVVKVDESGVADMASIQIKPLAKWIMREGKMDSVMVEYLGDDNIRNTIQDLRLIDEIAQDASGITRQFQGADAPGGGEETLGQTKIKMAAVEKRVMKLCKEISEDYVIPVIRHVFKLITHPRYVGMFQEVCDRTLGKKTVPNPLYTSAINFGLDPRMLPELQGMSPTIEVPKLDLKQLGELDLDFEFIGLVNYQQKTVIPEQMSQLLKLASNDPSLAMFIKKDKIIERWMQASDISDLNELMTDEKERADIQQAMTQQLMSQSQEQGGIPNGI